MKLIIFAGTPGSGKTSIIKHVVSRLKDEYKIGFVKFDCLQTDDDEFIHKKFGIDAAKYLAEDVCPDHYMALKLPEIMKEHAAKDIVILETAGLCLRCSPYLEEGLGISVVDVTTGNPKRYGPILTQADIVAISKGDLISQAEREIFRVNVLKMNPNLKMAEINGLTGEGAMDLIYNIKEAVSITGKDLTLKHPMPSAICGYCYGNKVISQSATKKRQRAGRVLKNLVPNLDCGKCGFKSCNEFIRSVLSGKTKKTKCPFVPKEKDDISCKCEID
jgi:Ni2+-binding GTPase involved in maturation of urease and hydrogenase